jgi:recombination protein U
MTKKGNFEQLISHTNAKYAELGIALIQFVHTPRDIHGKSIAKSSVDYVGTLYGGRSVAIECKETIHDHIPMSMLRPHQVGWLTSVNNLDGLGIFVVMFRAVERVFVFKPTLIWMQEHWNKRHQMSMNDCLRHGYEVLDWRNTAPICDYLQLGEVT